MNGDFNFTLYEPEVEVNSESPHIYTKEFFNITGSRIVGGKAEDETTLEVSTILPYEWTYTVTEGEDYFDIEVIDNKIIVSAKSDNDNEARSATILLNTNEGYSEVITVYQKTSKPHRIVLTSQHTNTYSSFNISGENITVKDPNDLEAVVYEGSIENRTIQIDGLSTGSTVVIEGDIITNFRLGGSDSSSKTDEYGYIYESYSENYGYYLSSYSRKSFTYSFENCAYLEDLAIQGADVSFDVSGMPNLRRLYIAHNPNLTEVIFGEKQKIEHLYIQYCDAIAGIDLSKIASTLKTANFYDSDKLSGVQFVDCANLKYLNVNGCGGIKIINLTGCTSLEDLYIYSVSPTNLNLTNCTSLKNLRLNSVTLDKLVTTGADNIENITTENTVSITNLNLAGKSKLSTLGAVYNVATFDISDTPKLSEVTVSFNSSSEQKLNLSGTNLTSVTFYNFNTNIDYSNLASCKKRQIVLYS